MWKPHERQGRKKKRTVRRDESAPTLAWPELRSLAAWATLSCFIALWQPPGNTYRGPGTDTSHLWLWEDLSFRYLWVGGKPWKETSLNNSKLQNYFILFLVFTNSWLEASRTPSLNISITATRISLAVLCIYTEIFFFFGAMNGHKKMSIKAVLKSSFLRPYCAGHIFVASIVCDCIHAHSLHVQNICFILKVPTVVTPGHTQHLEIVLSLSTIKPVTISWYLCQK
jgi:hypothetical protein